MREGNRFTGVVFVLFGVISLIIGIYLLATHTIAKSIVIADFDAKIEHGTMTGTFCIVLSIAFFVFAYLGFRDDKKESEEDAKMEKEEQKELKELEKDGYK